MNTESSINIIFHDQSITWLFSELLNSLKINNKVLDDESEIFESEYIITEPKYYNLVKNLPNTKCIVVGEFTKIESENTIQLCQPLTESKILAAISYLLEPMKIDVKNSAVKLN